MVVRAAREGPGNVKGRGRRLNDNVEHIFVALADPARLAAVRLLRKKPLRSSDVADALSLSRPIASRHLGVLRRAGLVEESSEGDDARVRTYRLRPEPFADLRSWLDEVEAFWGDQLQAFKAHAERKHGKGARAGPSYVHEGVGFDLARRVGGRGGRITERRIPGAADRRAACPNGGRSNRRPIEARHETAVRGRRHVIRLAGVGHAPAGSASAASGEGVQVSTLPLSCTVPPEPPEPPVPLGGLSSYRPREPRPGRAAKNAGETVAHQYFTQISSPAASAVSAVTPAVVLMSSVVVGLELKAAVPFQTMSASPKKVAISHVCDGGRYGELVPARATRGNDAKRRRRLDPMGVGSGPTQSLTITPPSGP